MNIEHILLQKIYRHILSLSVILSMLFPVVANSVTLLSDSEHDFESMALEQQEESEKEEQQEDDTKDEKIEMQILSPDDGHFPYASERAVYKPVDVASDYILEIPIPPPEYC